MTRDQIVALLTRRDQAWQRRDPAALAADYSEDAVGESPLQGRIVGRDSIRDVYNDWFTAFPDLSFKTDDLIVDGDRVAQFFTITGTQSGPFGGVPATGRKFQITGAWLYALGADGRIAHDRRVYDVTKMLIQIGALRTKPAEVIPSRPPVPRP